MVVTSILKGSVLSEKDIINPPFVLKEVNGMEVSNLVDLRSALHIKMIKNEIRYFHF